jgi:nucleoside-diphosphate-sugar epimerase
MELIETIEQLEEHLSRPTEGVLATMRAVDGDVLVLGAGGKMGPTLARMLRRGVETLSQKRRVLSASRFSSPGVAAELRRQGVETFSCDLTNRDAVRGLPDAPNIIYMAGQKFGTQDQPELTWVMNTLVPAVVAERYARSRIVVFSTGCVYALASVSGGGSREVDPLDPPGEYANSCIGRERIFAHFSRQSGTHALFFRLNYAIDLRYGVLLDIAQKVAQGTPVDVTMGYANVIWQGDANARAIQCLEHVSAPPLALNVTGREKFSIRVLAERFGELLGRKPVIVGQEAPTAWLADGSRSFDLLGPVTMTLDEMVTATAHWVRRGGATLGKPTHFDSRDGKF